MLACTRALEQGIRIPAKDGGAGGFDLQRDSTFEANVSHVLRFLVDHDLGGGRWLELPVGAFKVAAEPRSSTAQIEVEIEMDKLMVDGAGVRAISLDTDLGSSVPPVRTVALE